MTNSRELYGSYQNYTTQLRALESAARTKPDDLGLRFLLGYHYAYLGYPQQAVDQLDRVVRAVPADDVAKQMLAEMQGKLPKPEGQISPPTPNVRVPQAYDK